MLHFLSRQRPSRASMLAVVALAVAVGSSDAYATVKTFMLGQGNTSDAPTTVTASPTGSTGWPTTGSQRLLQLTNNNTTAGSTALGLTVASGHPPFTVNSGTKVANLNADKLDGLDSSGLVQGAERTGANRIAVTSPTPGSGTLLQVPGFGQMIVFCGHDQNGTDAFVSYRNDSGQSEDVTWADTYFDDSDTAGGRVQSHIHEAVVTNGAQDISDEVFGFFEQTLLRLEYQIGSGPSHLATVTVSVQMAAHSDTCVAEGQWVATTA